MSSSPSLKTRRKAREGALRVLYEVEVGGGSVEEAFASMMDETLLSDDLSSYALTLVEGTRSNLEPLDSTLGACVKEYDYNRLAAIDRNILRLAAFELLYLEDVPPAVTINEAIELAKTFSTAESGKFVNGVLSRVHRESPKANWDPATVVTEQVVREPEVAVEVETVDEESEEAQTARKFGQWKLKADDES